MALIERKVFFHLGRESSSTDNTVADPQILTLSLSLYWLKYFDNSVQFDWILEGGFFVERKHRQV